MNKDLIKHLDAGGKIVNENGHTLQRNKSSDNAWVATQRGMSSSSLHTAAELIKHLADYNWEIDPKSYEDGIYKAVTKTSKILNFLRHEKGCWRAFNEKGAIKINICHYDLESITRIGDLPREQTVADKIAAYPNDFVPDWDDHDQRKWYIVWEHQCQYEPYYATDIMALGVTYFRNEEETQKVIDEVLS